MFSSPVCLRLLQKARLVGRGSVTICRHLSLVIYMYYFYYNVGIIVVEPSLLNDYGRHRISPSSRACGGEFVVNQVCMRMKMLAALGY